MPNSKIDKNGFATVNADEERDLAAKGSPSGGVGIADDKHGISHPYNEDIQTQLAALSTQNKKEQPSKTEDKD